MTDPLLSLFELHWEDGRVAKPLARLDQPQIWQDSDGLAAALFLAVKERGDNVDTETAYNVHVLLQKTEKTISQYGNKTKCKKP